MPELKASQLVTGVVTGVAKTKTKQFTVGATAVGVAFAALVAVATGPWDSSGQRKAEAHRAASQETGGGADHGRTSAGAPSAAPSAPAVLAAPGASVPGPTKRALADVLDPLLRDSALGAHRTAAVVDAVTGRKLYGKSAGDALTPASTTKLATAVAALTAAGPDHRIATRTVLEKDTGGSGELILVGGGDPTLTAREKNPYDAASLRTLADRTAASLKAAGTTEVTLSYDTSLYSGPALHPIGVNDNLAQVSALMADEARTDDSHSGPAPRAADPAASAAGKFAGLLHDRGIRTKGDPGPSKASGQAEDVAEVESPPLSALVERMLTNSDNDIAEALARQAAIAADESHDFDGAGAAVKKELKKLGLPLSGAHFSDGSGLDRTDKASADLLTALLAKAADPAVPQLRSLLTGLPVAGFTGTLAHRYEDSADASGTGLVRAKTGTLTGVNTLAGTVVDADGRLLVFAFMTEGAPAPDAAVAALDRLASSVANCGCR
ncbi:D-alanyl-D-alanine carboxypeptidase/D-alanyl-D-alanine-endopeptidase [Streptomyces sp. VRA16 Mangrove soil]|uniref:D-alanyl-D-alanine carboxypeptidase/D-alanyl-D-alanine endopeptidase n=1 Tax=Streptomyces sp. VRA16 Mangrove soil TaxID=2817434 RepID=UPI001A9EFFA9|nr:D-alanyl-D-alanine carboxypeptidase/D-alanyl-D-alanine-endopeptidase [Streptomyces sp. VRA16 Mangrove soil]MBO1333845.1 D-alanyl-D-alanine carboxypeptidase/D-alanyl-D-alanine-endopeptidase [Streptomyces sp. VRA16 Mangrove soil]